ncbi:unnamed protein product [Durusdinium trenchii]|uniref:Uncharacterized protein n=1 Tax=Durusdinium trenchii TaxID=1381693 RepID=A0ABP0SDL8_9DINO
MTDCHGLSEDEAKMLLELELLAGDSKAVSATPPRGDEAPHRPSPKSSKARCGGQSQTRGNLGLRMRAVKEEEEEEERAVSGGFNIEMEYDADWTEEAEGSWRAFGPACRSLPVFCGSDVSTAPSSGGALFEDSQDNLLDLHAWEDNEPQEPLALVRECPGDAMGADIWTKGAKDQGRRATARRGPMAQDKHAKGDSGHHASSVGAARGAHASTSQATAQPKIRILVRPAAEVTELEHEVHMQHTTQKEAPEDPWCTGPDPWSMGRERGAQGRGGQGRNRRCHAG